MSTVTSDGQSYLIDGRRVWLVSGAIHYPRVPRAQWRSRLLAAREAGLNCIETYVFWNVHEPEPGRFTFEGDADLRHFVELIGELGMFCILRPGPYVCAEWDFGGLPGWLHTLKGMKLREKNGPYLEAVSRFLSAVFEQVKGLQVTGSGTPRPTRVVVEPGVAAHGYAGEGGGPIVLTQVENEWMSRNAAGGEPYFTELVRYLREVGCTTPLINCNNLVYRHAGTIDAWNGSTHLAQNVRQLAQVQPDAPRMVTEYWTGWFDHWGGGHADTVSAQRHLHRMAQMLAAGAMPNLFMFHGGTNFGFYGGRTINTPSCSMTTSYDYDAPLHEGGGRGEKYQTTKAIATFASHFAPLFAALKPDQQAAVLPDEEHGVSVIQQDGERGGVVFALRGLKDKTAQVDVLLPSGLAMPVHFGRDSAAWCVFDAELGAVATLELTNLRPWAFVGERMLVLFGPAGSPGVVVIDGTEYQFVVPKGKQPLIDAGGALTLVVLNEEQLDASALGGPGLHVGVAGLDDDGAPVALKGWSQRFDVALDGTFTKPRQSTATKPEAPALTDWASAVSVPFADPQTNALDWRELDGPASHEALGHDLGYGVYRVRPTRAVSGKMLAANASDRVHVYTGGKLQGVLGRSPGAAFEPADLTLGVDTVVLTDNLGRFCYGSRMGELKGLPDHFYTAEPEALGPPAVTQGPPADATAIQQYVAWGYMSADASDAASADHLGWSVRLTVKQPAMLEVAEFPAHWVLVVNGEPVTFAANEGPHAVRVLMDPSRAPFKSGKNDVQLRLTGRLPEGIDVAKHVRLHRLAAASAGATKWAFAPLPMPQPDGFKPAPKSSSALPTWHRAAFEVKDTRVPLFLKPDGLTKGQVYVNGHNAGRYFVRTHTNAAVPPQSLYYLPEAWLKTDAPNELLLFDEHGRPPHKCKLVYRALGPYGKE